MHKILATIVASSFVLASTGVLAATTFKKEELTQDQRVEMRSRADQLVKERAQNPAAAKAQAQPAPKAKALQVKKTKKVTRNSLKKTTPKA